MVYMSYIYLGMSVLAVRDDELDVGVDRRLPRIVLLWLEPAQFALAEDETGDAHLRQFGRKS